MTEVLTLKEAYKSVFEDYVSHLPLEDNLKASICNSDFIEDNPEFLFVLP